MLGRNTSRGRQQVGKGQRGVVRGLSVNLEMVPAAIQQDCWDKEWSQRQEQRLEYEWGRRWRQQQLHVPCSFYLRRDVVSDT